MKLIETVILLHVFVVVSADQNFNLASSCFWNENLIVRLEKNL